MVTTSSRKISWSSAWPCVLTNLLKDKKFAVITSELWKLLPTSFMQWWHVVAVGEGLDCTDCGMFADYSSKTDYFERLTKGLLNLEFFQTSWLQWTRTHFHAWNARLVASRMSMNVNWWRLIIFRTGNFKYRFLVAIGQRWQVHVKIGHARLLSRRSSQ